MADSLERYRQKRDFTKTKEPGGDLARRKGFSYLIQKHAASRLHYDFRLELDGVLKSWAVTKGPSLDPHVRRLAVEVEDHPVRYGAFEGTIPKGQYGGGTVMLWDRGTWEPVGDPHEGLHKGDLKFRLHGERLTGEWALVRMKPRDGEAPDKHNWLLIKHGDEAAREGDEDALLTGNMTSIVSGRTMGDIAAEPGKVWKSGKAQATKERHEPASAGHKKKALHLAFIEPELATLTDAAPDGGEWVHELKFDGYRTLALVEGGEVRMMTRTGLDWTPKFAALARHLAQLKIADAILDGEIVVVKDDGASSFKALQDALRDGRDGDLQYYLFDLLRLDGEDLRPLPLLQRKARLKALLDSADLGDRVSYSEHFGQDSSFIGRVCSLGMEGIISKRCDAPYRSGRNRSWLKTKCHKRQEFVIVGFREPTHAVRGIGALLLGYYEEETLVYAGKVGTGFDGESSPALRRRLDGLVRKTAAVSGAPPEVRREAIWVEPEVVCEVEFTEWTPDGRLRHPSFQGIRDDKPAREVGRDRELPAAKAEKAAEKEVAMDVVEKPATKAKAGKAEVGGVAISHPDRIIFPDTEITKLDLARYYDTMAEHVLPFVAGRPLSMVRCPEGIGGECFFQRHIPHASAHIRDTGIPVKGRDEHYIMIDDAPGLIAIIQWGAIELHPWGCRADRPDLPDRLIFDLDPDPEVPWDNVVAGAAEVRERMRELGLESFLKTTGGKGLHVVVPMQRKYGWPSIKAFARAVAESMAHDSPDRYIANMSKDKRKGRIFVDYLRNDLTSTAVSAWSVRARPGATVSTLLDWSELTPELKPSAFTIATVPVRVAKQKRDPWADFHTIRQMIRAEHLKALGIPT